MAYNHSGQPQRPNLPSIHNLNASYYPSFSPSASSSVPGMAEGSQNNGHRYAVGAGMPPQPIDQYGRTAGPSNVSDAHGVSPITQTPPETGGHPSPAPTSGSGGGGNHTGSSNNNNNKGAGSATGGSEFVKKLFNMLEDGMHNHIVSWGAKGDSFIVKDMNEFTKSILPKHFKHSNFASFVRQLNKYDFHKVKNPESNQADGHNEQLWEFKHPNFRSDMKSSLEQIKRKGPAPRKAAASTPNKADGAGISHEGCERAFNMFQQQLDTFAQDQHNLRAHVANLTRDYHGMINEVTNFRRAYVSQDHVMQNLVSVAARHDRSLGREEDPHRAMSAELQGLIAAYNDSARTSYELLEHISHRRPSLVSGRLLSGNRLVRESDQNETTPVTPSYFEADQRQQQQLLMQPPPTQQQQPMPPQPQARPPQPQHQPQPPQHQHPQTSLPHQQQQQHHSYQTNARPQPYGHQQKPSQGGSTAMPPQQQQQQQQPQVQPPPPQVPSQPQPQPQQQQQQQPQQQQQTSSKQSSVTPQWTIRPKILLVEDDAISRKLSFKFLEVLGCTIEVAEDGVSAVNKMNTEKYDLVFMDINMPNLDGVSATTLIRQFDPMTPIISMTSNSNPNEILTYFSHGMNDILPKPFTKEGVLGMLEKHLLHFKQMQQLTEIPRALGIPDDAIESALVSTFVDPSANNPFADIVADFGLTEDPDYVSMLASLVNGNNAANNQNLPATTDGGDPASAQSSGTAVDGSAAAANTSGGFRKRDMDESEMDDGSGHKRGRYSDVI